MNSRIEQAFTAQIFYQTRNWEILIPELSASLITCLEMVYRKTWKE